MKRTTDIWFASFLTALKEVSLYKYELTGTRKAEFYFDLSDEAWQSHRVEYFNSDLGKVRQAQDRLKDLLY